MEEKLADYFSKARLVYLHEEESTKLEGED
jgi:hypothetical protein